MKVKCKNGLCDRIKMTFSYLQKAKENGSVLEVIWPVDQECNGHFLDVFKPIKNMIFTEDESDLDFYGFELCPGYEKFSDYRELVPVDEALNKIFNMKEKMGKYAAIHVRRTDKLDPIKAPWFTNTENEEFFEFIESQNCQNVFLSADCADTQKLFKNRYGDRIIYSYEIEPSNNLRQTSLLHAVVDLSLCIRSTVFFGTSKSGFTKFIEANRASRQIKIL
jgi:hypothetical protein